MNAVVEWWRGGKALAGWVFGAPFANLRMLKIPDRKEAQKFLMGRATRTLESCGIFVETSGAGPPPGKGAVVVYNEASFADVLALCSMIFQHIERSSAADVFAKIPFTRAACQHAGIALVPRGNRAGVERVLAEMVEAVKAGERISWGGEGRLSGKDEVTRFKVGASLIAIRAGAPLFPVAFRGGHAVLPLGSVRARPGTIRVLFGAPLSTAGLGEEDARALSDRAQAAVASLFADLAPPAVSAETGSAEANRI